MSDTTFQLGVKVATQLSEGARLRAQRYRKERTGAEAAAQAQATQTMRQDLGKAKAMGHLQSLQYHNPAAAKMQAPQRNTGMLTQEDIAPATPDVSEPTLSNINAMKGTDRSRYWKAVKSLTAKPLETGVPKLMGKNIAGAVKGVGSGIASKLKY